jgi:hypothetical protein
MKTILSLCLLLPFVSYSITIPLELGEQWTRADEEGINHIIDNMRSVQIQTQVDNNDNRLRRDAHAKHHGCLKAQLIIDNTKLPKEFRTGLFHRSHSYDSIVRFSNGSHDSSKSDISSDARGMAIKIMGVENNPVLSLLNLEPKSQVHDIILLNAETFFLKNISTYVDLTRAQKEGGMALAAFGLRHANIIKDLLLIAGQKVYNPLDPNYHSATPYKVGKKSMRMEMRSCKFDKDSRPFMPNKNFLSHRLSQSVSKKDHCFEFHLHVNENHLLNPIEDPTKRWSQNSSSRYYVGLLYIPIQNNINTTTKSAYCEEMSFNPWRAPLENRPMGAVNRSRLKIYDRQAKFRNEENATSLKNPQSLSETPF